MKHHTRLFIGTIVLASLCLVVTATARQHGHHNHAHAALGNQAPEFELPGIDGKTYKLSQFKDKIVVLEWMNHECPYVKKAHDNKQMTGTLAKFKDKPVVWIGIDSSYFSADKSDAIKKWAGEKGIEYPILLDPKGEVGHIYAAKATPHMYVIDQKGKLVYTGAIDDQRDGDGQRNYIAEAVEALLAGSEVPVARTKPYGCSVKYKK